ncbi:MULTISPECIES: hypothetical protein [Eikenella]|uniref:Uncharacterized protein n=1 Tax=Eikenella exigua TaxID=2528037 RepID=A0AAX1F6N0_9NEIS|nr:MULTISPECIES: hypothetical protein [Eikenella]QED91732.1 hypothetical protein EZJ17_03120 [Eikenella exigua]
MGNASVWQAAAGALCHFFAGLVVDLGLKHGVGVKAVDVRSDGFGLVITIEDDGDAVLYVAELRIVADGLADGSIVLRAGMAAIPDEGWGVVGQLGAVVALLGTEVEALAAEGIVADAASVVVEA